MTPYHLNLNRAGAVESTDGHHDVTLSSWAWRTVASSGACRQSVHLDVPFGSLDPEKGQSGDSWHSKDTACADQGVLNSADCYQPTRTTDETECSLAALAQECYGLVLLPL